MRQNTCQIILAVLFLHVICPANTHLYGQKSPDDQYLDTIQISSARHQLLTPGHRREQIDSALIQEMSGQNLADILTEHSDVLIKSYGLGSLATTSLRGGGASHTAIVWNGFSLNSPMNGQLDLSLIPAFFLDRVDIQYGGSASLYGSGAVGGAIHLDNHIHFKKNLEAGLTLQTGSFGEQMWGGEFLISNKRWYSRTRIFNHQAVNDFLLPNGSARQTNAAYQQAGILQEGAIQISPRQQLQVWLWKQTSEREIPPPLSSRQAFAEQADDHVRIAAAWKRKGEGLDLQARAAYVQSGLVFRDSLAEIDADNQAQSLFQEMEAEWLVSPNHRLRLGGTFTHQQAIADGYGEQTPNQQRLAAFAAWHWLSPYRRWESVLSLRQEWMASQQIPLTPSLSLRGRINSYLQARAQIGRTFRLPTFNDLYWSPGGNPDLLPERGWHQEIGIYAEWKPQSMSLRSSTTLFSQKVDDWILWRPGPSYWFPENLRNVWSRGWEMSQEAGMEQGYWSIQLQSSYTYTLATITKVEQARDLSLGKQLIYTPKHQGRMSLLLRYKDMSLRYSHRLIGKRYTSTDNTYFLPAFDVASVRLGYEGQWKQWRTAGAIKVLNLWNQQYQVIENRAMPPRSILFSLHLYFTSLNTKDS